MKNWDKSLQEISLKKLKSFVIKQGWVQVGIHKDELAIFVKPENSQQDIVLPLRKNTQDYTLIILDLLGDLKEFAGVDTKKLLKKISLPREPNI
jgi:hypothetical protein